MKIKSCPFCGGKPYLERSQRGFVNGVSTRVCFVRCKKCNARSPRLDLHDYGHTSHSLQALEDVIEMWNTRTDKVFETEVELRNIPRDSTLELKPFLMEASENTDSELIL